MSGQHRRRSSGLRRRLVASLIALAASAGIVATVQMPGANGAYVAKVTNSSDTAASSAYFTCRAAETDSAVSTAYFSYPLSDANMSGASLMPAADVSGNGRAGNYTMDGVQFGQPSSVSPATPRTQQRHPQRIQRVRVRAEHGPAVAGPSTFTEEIWFKTSTGGGKLIGFGSSRTGTSCSFDRHLYLSNTGVLVFGVYPEAVKTITSGSATYLDNKWHYAAATLSSTAGMSLYVDGALVGSDPSVTTAQTDYSGYWRIGFDNLANWGPTTPSNYYFTGSLAWASVHTTKALTAAQILAHYNAGR